MQDASSSVRSAELKLGPLVVVDMLLLVLLVSVVRSSTSIWVSMTK